MQKFRLVSFQIRRDSNYQITPEGYLIVRAYATRTGVFDYYTKEGKLYKEYRPKTEVFDPNSYNTLKNQPITKLHPKKMLDSASVTKFLKGLVLEDIGVEEDTYIAVTLKVMDREVVDLILSGKMTELSCGYFCEVVDGKGTTPEGLEYDGIQMNIRYNHLALVPKGRAGNQVGIKLDAEGCSIFDDEEEKSTLQCTFATNEKTIKTDAEKGAKQMDFIYKGKTYKLDNEADRAELAKVLKADEAAGILNQSKIDALQVEVEILKTKKTDSPDELTEKLAFLAEVSQYIKADTALEELAKNSPKTNKIQAVKDNFPKLELKEDDSDARIDTAYEIMKSSISPKKVKKDAAKPAMTKCPECGATLDKCAPKDTKDGEDATKTDAEKNDGIAKIIASGADPVVKGDASDDPAEQARLDYEKSFIRA